VTSYNPQSPNSRFDIFRQPPQQEAPLSSFEQPQTGSVPRNIPARMPAVQPTPARTDSTPAGQLRAEGRSGV